MKCPVCREPDLVITDRQGIEIDYCPQCRGIWLDRGELDKIIERTAPQASADSYRSERGGERDRDRYAGGYRHDDDYYEHKHKKKKGGLLGELFDF
ncbi:MAG: zf-TFIIB domain-containing protein [Bacteroidia bacterium]|nr:zf-TFIIB domain-containing protein [Bacteroidia bacterium]